VNRFGSKKGKKSTLEPNARLICLEVEILFRFTHASDFKVGAEAMQLIEILKGNSGKFKDRGVLG